MLFVTMLLCIFEKTWHYNLAPLPQHHQKLVPRLHCFDTFKYFLQSAEQNLQNQSVTVNITANALSLFLLFDFISTVQFTSSGLFQWTQTTPIHTTTIPAYSYHVIKMVNEPDWVGLGKTTSDCVDLVQTGSQWVTVNILFLFCPTFFLLSWCVSRSLSVRLTSCLTACGWSKSRCRLMRKQLIAVSQL